MFFINRDPLKIKISNLILMPLTMKNAIRKVEIPDPSKIEKKMDALYHRKNMMPVSTNVDIAPKDKPRDVIPYESSGKGLGLKDSTTSSIEMAMKILNKNKPKKKIKLKL